MRVCIFVECIFYILVEFESLGFGWGWLSEVVVVFDYGILDVFEEVVDGVFGVDE